MCGIVGFNFCDKDKLDNCLNLISHRGPDSTGTFLDNYISLGHKRLSIVDLSTQGTQPMSKLHYTITFNGEIYNFHELKKDLKEYEFSTTTDTEVIIYAYDKWNKDCLNKFNGMFSFCIYDHQKNELFIARDRFGVKPLYYINSCFIAFCSEIKGLIPFLDKKEIDLDGLTQFFSYRYTLGERTLLKGVKKFLPGHYMLYDLKNKNIKTYNRYYHLDLSQDKNQSFEYYKEKLYSLLDDAVKLRTIADVPVACFLSGGIDSSIITALTKQYNSNLNTFSIGFDTTNELPYARQVANFLGTNHHEFIVNKDNLFDYLDDMVWHMDEPVGDAGFLPIFVLSKEARKYNKVILSGDGADELFCGYDRYKLLYYGQYLKRLVHFDFDNDLLKKIKNMNNKTDQECFFEIIRLFDNQELKKLGLLEYDGRDLWVDTGSDSVSDAQLFDINTLLPNDFFMKSDKMSSAFGLEQRIPFLDYRLVEFSFSIPLKHKLRLWNEKYILKKTFENFLPPGIIKRRKHGFDVPMDYWFKGRLNELLIFYLKNNDHKLYNKLYIYELLEKIKSYGDNYKLNFILSQKLWSILMFEMWYDKYIKSKF